MIDEATARSIAQAYFDQKSQNHTCNFVIREGGIIEKEYGWIICSIAQEYLDRDPRLMVHGMLLHLIGGYPRVVVERESGARHPLNVNWSNLEMDIADFEAWRFFHFSSQFYDLTIRLVRDLEKTLELLPCSKFLYLRPFLNKVGEGVRPYSLTDEKLRELLNQLPITFPHLAIRPYYRDLQRIDSTGCCEYELTASENQEAWWKVMQGHLLGKSAPGQFEIRLG